MSFSEENALIANHLLSVLEVFLHSTRDPGTFRMQSHGFIPLGTGESEGEDLAQTLLIHGLLGIYEMTLKEYSLWERLDPRLQEKVDHGVSGQWTQASHLAALQDEVVALFSEREVRFLVLKGLPLSERLYDHAFLRPASDVDLLLHPADFQKGTEILKEHEFMLVQQNHAFHQSWQTRKFPGVLEVHHALTDFRFAFDLGEIFRRTHTEKLSGQSLAVMDPADEFLYLACHHANHYLLFRWLWLLDVAQWLNRFGFTLDWPEVRARMHVFRLEKAVIASLTYCDRYFGKVWPEPVRDDARSFLREFPLGKAAKNLLDYAANPRRPFDSRVLSSGLARKAVGLWLAQGWGFRLQACARKILGTHQGITKF